MIYFMALLRPQHHLPRIIPKLYYGGGHHSRLRILRIRSGGPNLRYFPRANEEPSSFYPLFQIQRMA